MTNTTKTKLKYDGVELENHAIEIGILCPSLVALAKLVKKSNKIINGENAADINIKVNANTKQNSFQLVLEFVANVDIYIDIGNFIPLILPISIFWDKKSNPNENHNEKKEDLFSLTKKFKGKDIDQSQITEDGDNIKITGDNNEVTVNRNVYHIYASPETQEHMKNFLKPLGKNGIEKITVGEKDNPISFDKEDYEDFTKNLREKNKKTKPDCVTTKECDLILPDVNMLNITSNEWSFLLQNENGTATLIRVDISNTGIKENAQKRLGVKFGDSYRVKLKETTYKTSAKYKITEVLKFPNGEK